MPNRSSALLLVLAFSCLGLPARAEGDLERRAWLGLQFKQLTEEQAGASGIDKDAGVFVAKVLPGGPADQAGLHAGDVITRIGGKEVHGESGFADLVRSLHDGDKVDVDLLRGVEVLRLPLVALAPPKEADDDLDIEYTSFTSNGVRLRAVVVSPRDSHEQKLPALLVVSALTSQRLIDSPSYSMSRSVAHSVARAGFRVMRFELRGYGDSEGEDYRTTGFEAEVGDNFEAFDWLAKRADVDRDRIYVWGHSTGGMEAAILAGFRPVKGLIASGTIGRTYFERMGDTLRLQGELAGHSPVEIDATITRYVRFAAAIARGETKEEILAHTPADASFFNAFDRIMDDRTVQFWREQFKLNLAEVYGKVKAPVLLLWGESDFITTRACHEELHGVLLTAGNQDVELVTLPGLDHAFAQARDFAESYRNRQSGELVENPAAREKIAEWLGRH